MRSILFIFCHGQFPSSIRFSSVCRMAGMVMIKQNNYRKAEKALKEILNKADSNDNGRVELRDFMTILEGNRVEVKIFF